MKHNLWPSLADTFSGEACTPLEAQRARLRAPRSGSHERKNGVREGTVAGDVTCSSRSRMSLSSKTWPRDVDTSKKSVVQELALSTVCTGNTFHRQAIPKYVRTWLLLINLGRTPRTLLNVPWCQYVHQTVCCGPTPHTISVKICTVRTSHRGQGSGETWLKRKGYQTDTFLPFRETGFMNRKPETSIWLQHFLWKVIFSS